MKPYLSVIIPVKDDEASLLQTLLAVDYALSLSEFSSEIVVVDRGSRDATSAIAANFAKVSKSLRAVELGAGHGVGSAIKEGLAAAHGNLRMVLFPQCAAFLDRREEVASAIRAGADLAVGTRNAGTEKLPFRRALARRLRAAENKLLCGKAVRGVSDASFGGFCLTEEAAGKLLAFPKLSDGPDLVLELLLLATRGGMKVREIHFDDPEGKCSWCPGAPRKMKAFAKAFAMRRKAKKLFYETGGHDVL